MPSRPRSSTASSKPAAAKPTLVLLVRHGQTSTTGKVLPGRAPGLHLSAVGRAQAEQAGQRIAALKQLDAIYVSPLERTRETAKPIAAATGVKSVVERGLLECDFGDWTGQELKALMKLPAWSTVQRSPSTFRFPGGESFVEMQLRMLSTLDRLRLRHPGGTIVCVSHADPIKAAMAHLGGAHLDQFQRLVISPCSISAALLGAATPIVLCVNSTGGPLSELQPS